MYSDTMFASSRIGKSLRGFTCAQVFTTNFDWCSVLLMEFETEIPKAFKSLFKDVGVPERMVMDGARAQVSAETLKICQLSGCTIVELEKNTPSANRAELTIGKVKCSTRHDMKETKSPIILWCFCLSQQARIHSSCARDIFKLEGATPQSFLSGDITDISNTCAFGWYKWVKFRREGVSSGYPYPTEHLGQCLGPAENKGNALSQHVLMIDGSVLPIQTLRSLKPSEVENEIDARRHFDEKIRIHYGDHLVIG